MESAVGGEGEHLYTSCFKGGLSSLFEVLQVPHCPLVDDGVGTDHLGRGVGNHLSNWVGGPLVASRGLYS